MAQLFVEPEKIVRARELARSAALGVQAFIDQHTTVSIERTVLRLLGISGAGSRGAPLANLMVDRLREAGVLGQGAAYWLGRALRASPGKEPLQAIERITAHPEKLPPLKPEEDAQLREEMRSDARSAVRELKSRIDQRKALEGIIYRARTGCQWSHLPAEFGDDVSVHPTMQRWESKGVFDKRRF